MARMIVHNMLGGWGGCQVPGELRVKWYIISRFSIYLANCQRVQCFILMSELMCLIANYLRRFLPPRVLWTSYMADLDPILPLILSGKDVQETPSLRDTKVMPRWPPWDAVTISRWADEQMSWCQAGAGYRDGAGAAPVYFRSLLRLAPAQTGGSGAACESGGRCYNVTCDQKSGDSHRWHNTAALDIFTGSMQMSHTF